MLGELCPPFTSFGIKEVRPEAQGSYSSCGFDVVIEQSNAEQYES